MNCLYLEEKNKCKILKKKECLNCNFYKKNTKQNYNKFIIQVEKDILIYQKNK